MIIGFYIKCASCKEQPGSSSSGRSVGGPEVIRFEVELIIDRQDGTNERTNSNPRQTEIASPKNKQRIGAKPLFTISRVYY